MTPKKAMQILDTLGIEYDKVTMAHCLLVKFKDGSRIAFKKLLRQRELAPTEELVPCDAPIVVEEKIGEDASKVETEKIVAKKTKKSKS